MSDTSLQILIQTSDVVWKQSSLYAIIIWDCSVFSSNIFMLLSWNKVLSVDLYFRCQSYNKIQRWLAIRWTLSCGKNFSLKEFKCWQQNTRGQYVISQQQQRYREEETKWGDYQSKTKTNKQKNINKSQNLIFKMKQKYT